MPIQDLIFDSFVVEPLLIDDMMIRPRLFYDIAHACRPALLSPTLLAARRALARAHARALRRADERAARPPPLMSGAASARKDARERHALRVTPDTRAPRAVSARRAAIDIESSRCCLMPRWRCDIYEARRAAPRRGTGFRAQQARETATRRKKGAAGKLCCVRAPVHMMIHIIRWRCYLRSI